MEVPSDALSQIRFSRFVSPSPSSFSLSFFLPFFLFVSIVVASPSRCLYLFAVSVLLYVASPFPSSRSLGCCASLAVYSSSTGSRSEAGRCRFRGADSKCVALVGDVPCLVSRALPRAARTDRLLHAEKSEEIYTRRKGESRACQWTSSIGTEARVTEKCSQSLAQLPLQRDARTRPENAKDEQRRWGLQRERNDACGDREEARREVGEEEEAEGQAACRDKAPQREPRSEAAGGEESEAEATGASQVAVEDQQERETKASFVRNCADGMLKALAVPVQKSLFLHFYLLGAGLSLAMALLLSLALRRCRLSLAEKNDTPVSALLSNASPDNIPQGPSSNGQRGKSDLGRLVNEAAAGMATDADLLLPLLLFFLHCLRRLLEQLFVVRTHATASQMSLAAYLLGLRQATLREKEEEKKGREESERKDDGREAKSGEEQKNAK